MWASKIKAAIVIALAGVAIALPSSGIAQVQSGPSKYKAGDIVEISSGRSGWVKYDDEELGCQFSIKSGMITRVNWADKYLQRAELGPILLNGKPVRVSMIFLDDQLSPAPADTPASKIESITLTGCLPIAEAEAAEKSARWWNAAFVLVPLITIGIALVGWLAYRATNGFSLASIREEYDQIREARAREQEAQARAKEEEALYLKRWPEARFPRLDEPENAKKGWATLLARWPMPPATEEERQKNEAVYWERKLESRVVKTENGVGLQPKQQILDDFMEHETWYLREYFAATGIYHELFHGPEMKRLIDKCNEAGKREEKYSGYDAQKSPQMHALWNDARTEERAAIEKLEEYRSKGKREFIEKRGGWFFSRIELAFKEKYRTIGNFGAPTAETPDHHPAQDDLAYKPQS